MISGQIQQKLLINFYRTQSEILVALRCGECFVKSFFPALENFFFSCDLIIVLFGAYTTQGRSHLQKSLFDSKVRLLSSFCAHLIPPLHLFFQKTQNMFENSSFFNFHYPSHIRINTCRNVLQRVLYPILINFFCIP